MKRLKKIHLIIILACFVSITPPAQATYQDSVILQFLIAKFNYIMEYVNKAGFALQHLTKQIGNMTLTNAEQQSTEVQSGVVAENTKTLGKIKYALEFGGQIASNEHDGRSFWVSAVSSVGCVLLDQNRKARDADDDAGDVENVMVEAVTELKDGYDSTETQRIAANTAITQYGNVSSMPSVLARRNNIPDDISEDAADVITVVTNKKLLSKNSRWRKDGPVGLNEVDLYGQLTETISDVAIKNYVKGVSVSGEGSVANNIKVSAKMRMSDNYVLANNLKTQKGVKADLVEGNYSLLLLRLEQLSELRQQEKLHTVRALTLLRNFHKEQLK
jgi:hypothetical protein